MDRGASVPVSESIASLVDSLAERLKKPKKEVVEEAIQSYAANIEEEGIAEFIKVFGNLEARRDDRRNCRKRPEVA